MKSRYFEQSDYEKCIFRMMNEGPPPQGPVSQDAPVAGVLPFDADRYREHVNGFDLSEEQQVEFLRTLFHIMSAFVDLGFHVDSVQRLLPAFAEACAEASSISDTDEVEQRGRECTPEFNDAAEGKTDHGP